MAKQKNQDLAQAVPEHQRVLPSKETDSLSDPIAREEMNDAMGTEWDRQVAKNDGAAPSGGDGQMQAPLFLGLLSAFDETVEQEEEASYEIQDLLARLRQQIESISTLPEEEREKAILELNPLIDACKAALSASKRNAMMDPNEEGLFSALLDRVDDLSIDSLA